MADITQILSRLESGDPSASDELLPLVYEELRQLARIRMANERSDHTLSATALVHEAYLRLVGSEQAPEWDSRGHFFSAAAEAMRRILVNRARDRNRLKRGGQLKRVDLEEIELALTSPPDQLLAINESIERLSQEDRLASELVKLRFFAGLTLREAAQSLGVPGRTADRHWAYAKAWIFDDLQQDS